MRKLSLKLLLAPLVLAAVLWMLWEFRYSIEFYGRIALLRRSSDGNATLRTADKLEHIGPRIKELLTRAYDDTKDDPRVRIVAASLLSKTDRVLAEQVVGRHLSSDNPSVVTRAVRDLWAMGASGYVDEVVSHMMSKDPHLREAVALYLGLSSRADVVEVLRNLEESDPDGEVRKTASRSLEVINTKQ